MVAAPGGVRGNLDLQMPGMSGFELLKTMRADAALADIPVLLLITAADKALVERAAKLRVKGYVPKTSFSMTDLLARVKHARHAGGRRPDETRHAPPAA